MKLSQLSLATQLYVAFAVFLFVTITLAGCAIVRVNSIGTSLGNAETFRAERLAPLYAAREALAQTGTAARNAFIFQDAAAAGRELEIVDAKRRSTWPRSTSSIRS